MSALIAVTGGIAAGKTVLTDYCAHRHGIPVLDTDTLTHQLLTTDSTVQDGIFTIFGAEVFTQDGKINRQLLREKVFTSLSDKQALEKIMHPKIRDAVSHWASGQKVAFVLVAVPLLVETNTAARYDRIIVVDSSLEARYSRCLARGLSSDMAKKIMDMQATRWERAACADDLVYNMRSFSFFHDQIDRLICQYRRIYPEPRY